VRRTSPERRVSLPSGLVRFVTTLERQAVASPRSGWFEAEKPPDLRVTVRPAPMAGRQHERGEWRSRDRLIQHVLVEPQDRDGSVQTPKAAGARVGTVRDDIDRVVGSRRPPLSHDLAHRTLRVTGIEVDQDRR
jgi:hypothetical protein